MALIFILGRPGSGKSYTALEKYIDPALRQERRVFHNLGGFTGQQGAVFDAAPLRPPAGLSPVARALWRLRRATGFGGKFAPACRLSRCCKFRGVPLFPDLQLDDEGHIVRAGVVEDNPNMARGGDLVVIDEYYLVRRQARYSYTGGALEWDKSLAQFVRGHRHLTDGKNSSDVLIMSQSDDEIPESLRQCAEKTIICKSHILGGGGLRRLFFDGFRKVAYSKAENAIQVENYKPRPALCARYASYTGGAAKERHKGFGFMVLARKNIFVSVFLIAFLVWGIQHLLSGALWGVSGQEREAVAAGGGGGAVAPVAAAPVEWVRSWECRAWLDGDCLVEY